VCRLAERPRIDYLLALGSTVKAVARQFNVGHDACTRHFANHVTDDFKRQVRLGPYDSEERLRALCADGGVSVLETLKAIYAPLAARYMAAFEAGADQVMIGLASRMQANLMDQARLTRELMPHPSNVSLTQNIVMTPGWFEGFSGRMVEFARRHPEIREDLMRVLREGVTGSEAPMLNITAGARDAAA